MGNGPYGEEIMHASGNSAPSARYRVDPQPAHNAHVSMCCTHAQAKGVPLASNQVQYSLLYRVPERNGVADASARRPAQRSSRTRRSRRACSQVPPPAAWLAW